MSKRRKTRKAQPAKSGCKTFTLTIEGQPMVVSYEPHWMRDVGHFEFRSPCQPPKRIPVSETGYRSCYAPMEQIDAASSPEDFAREVALALLRREKPRSRDDAAQLSLF